MIEVMVALAVLAFGMLGVAAVQVSALRATSQSRERALAHELAQQQLEIFHERSTRKLSIGFVMPKAGAWSRGGT